MDVATVEAELGFTPEVAGRIEAESAGVRRTIQRLREQAEKNVGYVARYRSLLIQAMEQVGIANASDVVEKSDPADVWRDFWRWRGAEEVRIGASDRAERRLPKGVDDWIAKWLPDHWKRYNSVLGVVLAQERPTVRQMERLRQAVTEMLTVYVKF